ncbi:MAG: carboxynorspermidine decarboxylase [Myxococcaceae bacterium]|nr:MAG: carboxynorspermidine decarboxylase [Myxococcaceae bacterium]
MRGQDLSTPYYLIDEARLASNMEKIARLRELSGAKVLLALKCFAAWSVFDKMAPFMDGTTSSSLHEVRLGQEKFGGETHAYCVAWADDEVSAAARRADKIIFNSIAQFERFKRKTRKASVGLRLNPRISASDFELADPAQPFSRLGEWDPKKVEAVVDRLSGFTLHYNCDNAEFDLFDEQLFLVEKRFGALFSKVEWVSLGGGVLFTGEGYPLEKFARRLKAFSEKHDVCVYLEPGEAAITDAATLEVTVLDLLNNGKDLAIVDASVEAHMLDLLIYGTSARMSPDQGPHHYRICGRSCLAGDVFGEFDFPAPLKVGDRLSILDAAGYSMVKKNWFNGMKMPAIAIRAKDGTIRVVREFTYREYVKSLS